MHLHPAPAARRPASLARCVGIHLIVILLLLVALLGVDEVCVRCKFPPVVFELALGAFLIGAHISAERVVRRVERVFHRSRPHEATAD